MKLIYLDLDGVLCLPSQWGTRTKLKRKFDSFDRICVDNLNKIIFHTDCELVISSDWRLHGSLEELQWHFRDQGIDKLPMYTTPNLNYKRNQEIMKSVEILIPSNWVAIDDLPLTVANFIQTKESLGLKESGITKKIINFLNEV